MQTDIYAVLVERHFEALGTPLHVVGSVYRSYSKNNMRGVYAHGLNWGNAEVKREDLDAMPRQTNDETYDEYLCHVEDEIADCMRRLRDGDIAPNPIAKDVCEFCKVLSFCPRGNA